MRLVKIIKKANVSSADTPLQQQHIEARRRAEKLLADIDYALTELKDSVRLAEGAEDKKQK